MTDAHLTDADTLALVRGEPVSADSKGHLDRCPDCAARVQEQQEVWNVLESGSPVPRSEALWDVIESQLTPPLADRPRVAILPWALAAALVLSLGLGSWWQLSSLRTRITSLEIANAELALGHGSASVRLAAVSDLAEAVRDDGTEQTLFHLLSTDPNEHVRVLALEALRGSLESGALSPEALVELLATEPSPLVQSDLIVWILLMGGPGMLTEIREALPTASVHPFVANQLTES